jgi:hypothetical protein
MPARRILALAASLIAAAGAAAATASPASAATVGRASVATARCSGYSCHGRNPTNYDCTAVTSTVTAPVKSGRTQVATLYNRYNSVCNANWAEAQLTAAGLKAHDQIIVAIATVDSHGHYEFACYPGPNNTGQLIEACSGTGYLGGLLAYSDMVDGTNTTTATVGVYNSSGKLLVTASASQ